MPIRPENRHRNPADEGRGGAVSELAWHFVGDALRDGGPVPPDGEWLEHEGKVVLCESGLHASVDVWDALGYAPGPVLCRVEVDGVIVYGVNKLAASRRRILRRVDMTDALRTYARDEARRVMHLWDPPDIVREYLETGREDIRSAARAAAWAAARNAAWDAAGYGGGLMGVTATAIRAPEAMHPQVASLAGAARAAAWAAQDAAWGAARAAALAAQDAAGGAARDAAWGAAWDASAARFRAVVAEHFPDEVGGRQGA